MPFSDWEFAKTLLSDFYHSDDAFGTNPTFVLFEENPFWHASMIEVFIRNFNDNSSKLIFLSRAISAPMFRSRARIRVGHVRLKAIISLVLDISMHKALSLRTQKRLSHVLDGSHSFTYLYASREAHIFQNRFKSTSKIKRNYFSVESHLNELDKIVDQALAEEYANSRFYRFSRRFLVRRYKRSARKVFQILLEILSAEKPSSLVYMNGRTLYETVASLAAQVLHIKSFALEHSSDNSRIQIFPDTALNISFLSTSMDVFCDAYSAIKGTDDIVRNADEYLSAKTSSINFNPYLKFHNGKYEVETHLCNKKYSEPFRILFLTSSTDEMEHLQSHMRLPSIKEIDVLQDLMSFVNNQEDTELVIRVHPNMRYKSQKRRSDYDQLVESGRIKLYNYFDNSDTYELIRNASIVITHLSSLAIDAALMDKPVASICPSVYNLLGFSKQIEDFQQLKSYANDSVSVEISKEKARRFVFFSTYYGLPLINHIPHENRFYYGNSVTNLDPIRIFLRKFKKCS